MCLLVDALRPDEEREVLARRGHLNCINPVFADRYYRLDLSIWDEREMAKILVRLVRIVLPVIKTLTHGLLCPQGRHRSLPNLPTYVFAMLN